MAKYRVYIERITTEWAEVFVEAADEDEAGDKAWDKACDGDVDFEWDSEPTLEIMEVDLVEADAD